MRRICSAWLMASKRLLIVSITIVAASTTVGMPTAITGIPMLSRLSACLWFPTPEPGLIPVSVICIVRFRRLVPRAASASTAIMTSGPVSFVMPRTISIDSIPVCAITPGTILLTGFWQLSPRTYLPNSLIICLVIQRLSTTLGPRESGVTARFPSPTTSVVNSFFLGSRRFKILDSCTDISRWQSSSSSVIFAASSVT